MMASATKLVEEKESKRIEIISPKFSCVEVWLEGLTPLLINPLTQRYVDSKKPGSASSSEVLPPEEEYEEKLKCRRLNGKFYHPTEAFTGNMGVFLRAASSAKIKKVNAKTVQTALSIRPDILLNCPEGIRPCTEIITEKGPEMDFHMAFVLSKQTRVPIPVYRPRFDDWKMKLTIDYWPTLVNQSALISLVTTAGLLGCGAFKLGGFGRFRLVKAEQHS